MRISIAALGIASAFGVAEAFHAPSPMALRRSVRSTPAMGLRKARVAGEWPFCIRATAGPEGSCADAKWKML